MRTISQWLDELRATSPYPDCVAVWEEALAALPPDSCADTLFGSWAQGIMLADPVMRRYWSDLSGWGLYSMWSLGSLELEDADLSNADLTGADMVGIRLTRVNLSGANLTGSSMSCAYLAETDMRSVVARQAIFELALVTDCNLQYSNLKGADFGAADIISSSFKDADLTCVSFRRANITNCNMVNIKGHGMDIRECSISQTKIKMMES
jgi:uncharacterized protein YjbI with pentapeptide repeats